MANRQARHLLQRSDLLSAYVWDIWNDGFQHSPFTLSFIFYSCSNSTMFPLNAWNNSPCWQHPGQRDSTPHSQGNGPEPWTWKSSSGGSAPSFHLKEKLVLKKKSTSVHFNQCVWQASYNNKYIMVHRNNYYNTGKNDLFSFNFISFQKDKSQCMALAIITIYLFCVLHCVCVCACASVCTCVNTSVSCQTSSEETNIVECKAAAAEVIELQLFTWSGSTIHLLTTDPLLMTHWCLCLCCSQQGLYI